MNYSPKISIGIIILLISAGSCTVQVRTFQKPRVDFTSYATWCWMKGCDITYQGPEYYYSKKAMEEISNAIAWNIHDKGYKQEDDKSDLLVNFYVIMQQDSTEISRLYYSDSEEERMWLPKLYPEYEFFMKGNLVIDILDRRSSDLIWRSSTVRYMELNPEYNKEDIWNGVKRALRKFPERKK